MIGVQEWIVAVVRFADSHQGFCMVLLTTALALCAIVSCILAYKNIKALKESELERARPVVILEIIPDVPFYIVRLRNAGLTAARSITVEMSPNMEYCFERWKGKAIGFLNRKIDFLAPNASLQTNIGAFRDIEKHNPALLYKGVVRYLDASGRAYEDLITLDFSLFTDTVYSGKKTINDIGVELEKIRRAIESFGSGFHKLRIIGQSLDDFREEERLFVEQIRAQKENPIDATIAPTIENSQKVKSSI